MLDVALVDYGMGNIRSVRNALQAAGAASVDVVDDPEQLATARRIVLPGVGAFGDGMQALRSRGWVEALETEVLGRRKPLLGLCLGMQLLATTSTEHGEHQGLDWISGRVVRLSGEVVRVPHVGWNDVVVMPDAELYAGIADRASFYFVHSYHVVPDDPACVTGTTDYPAAIVASISSENIHATQYHPEKSHHVGLLLLRNFLSM